MSTNTVIFFVTISLFVVAISSISAAPEKSREKLLDLDSKTQAQVYLPTPPPAQLPPLISVPPFLRNLVPSSKNGHPDASLPLFIAPQFINPLSKDLFSLSSDMLNVFRTLFQFPPDMNYRQQINQVRRLMDNGLIPEQYLGYARAYLSLLSDQPVLRALQDSVSKLQKSTSFNFSTSGEGLDNLRLNYDFNLPDTMITPAIQSSFGIASNSEAAAAAPTRVGSKIVSEVSDIEMDEDPFLHE